MPQSELMHTARQGKWPPPWLLFPWQGDSVVIALRDKSHCSLSSPVVHSQIRGCFQAGLPVLEACGLMVTITAKTTSIILDHTHFDGNQALGGAKAGVLFSVCTGTLFSF